MKMPVHNFDEHFAEFMSGWMEQHKNDYRNFDEMEEDLPRIYMAFLNTRAPWLGSVTPGSYFTQFEDPKVLVDWLREYCEEGVPVPEPLLNDSLRRLIVPMCASSEYPGNSDTRCSLHNSM